MRTRQDSFFVTLQPRPEFELLARSLKSAGFPVALVSSSRLRWIHKILGKRKDLLELFDFMVTFEDVDEHKPSPKPYLLAVSRLNLKALECVAIEDSFHGIISAKTAGCRVVALESKQFPQDTSKADLVVKSLSELSVQFLSSV
jgi:HAD superfamily hydrolase (TIGR01509 family)